MAAAARAFSMKRHRPIHVTGGPALPLLINCHGGREQISISFIVRSDTSSNPPILSIPQPIASPFTVRSSGRNVLSTASPSRRSTLVSLTSAVVVAAAPLRRVFFSPNDHVKPAPNFYLMYYSSVKAFCVFAFSTSSPPLGN